MNSLLKAAAPNSDQLNADDLVDTIIIATITDVKLTSGDQPVTVHLDGGYRPWKPCKTMVRVLVAAYGDDPANLIGNTVELYCDKTVKYGKDPVGGIRISRLSHIDKTLKVLLTISRGRRRLVEIQPLPTQAPNPTYPQEMFDKHFDGWANMVETKKKSPSAIIAQISSKYTLTKQMSNKIHGLVKEGKEGD